MDFGQGRALGPCEIAGEGIVDGPNQSHYGREGPHHGDPEEIRSNANDARPCGPAGPITRLVLTRKDPVGVFQASWSRLEIAAGRPAVLAMMGVRADAIPFFLLNEKEC